MRLTDYGLEIVRVMEPPGYKLRYPSGDDDGCWIEGVIADGDDTAADPDARLDGMERLLNFIMGHFGYYGSKHDAERLRVVRERQDGTIVHMGDKYAPAVNDDDDDTEYVMTSLGQAELARRTDAELDALAEATKKA